MPNRIKLIRTQPSSGISYDSLIEFESVILDDRKWEYYEGYNEWFSKIYRGIDKYIPITYRPKTSQSRHEHSDIYFMTDLNMPKGFPHYHFGRGFRSLWMYDAWEKRYPEILDKIKRYDLNAIFFSAKQPSDYFRSLDLPNFECHWIPEAINVDLYKSRSMHERGIDVLQMGRKWDFLHLEIRDKCADAKINYLFEKLKGKIIFETREEFIEGLSNSKISVCVPSSLTHPERSGNVSTVTSRYFQAFASKCLVWGVAPDELRLLFPYNPIIEIDVKEPFEQLKYILENINQYTDLVEKNYQYVRQHHQWINRLSQLNQILLDKV